MRAANRPRPLPPSRRTAWMAATRTAGVLPGRLPVQVAPHVVGHLEEARGGAMAATAAMVARLHPRRHPHRPVLPRASGGGWKTRPAMRRLAAQRLPQHQAGIGRAAEAGHLPPRLRRHLPRRPLRARALAARPRPPSCTSTSSRRRRQVARAPPPGRPAGARRPHRPRPRRASGASAGVPQMRAWVATVKAKGRRRGRRMMTSALLRHPLVAVWRRAGDGGSRPRAHLRPRWHQRALRTNARWRPRRLLPRFCRLAHDDPVLRGWTRGMTRSARLP
jgi:hypothetical protein